MDKLSLTRNGAPCVLCLSRKKLIHLTPEEGVRQALIGRLIAEYSVPADHIHAEVPVAGGGRIDLLVTNGDTTEHPPLLVVECKAPGLPLIDGVLAQAARYNRTLHAPFVAVTNGAELLAYRKNRPAAGYTLLKAFPSFADMLQPDGLEAEPPLPPFRRPNYRKQPQVGWHYQDCGLIGFDTDQRLFSFCSNLAGLLWEDARLIRELPSAQATLVQDGGIRYASFGNITGGSWSGDYRYLVVRDAQGEHGLVSFALLAKMKTINHPRYGNARGETMLIVAVDDFEKTHNALQLSLDRFVHSDGDRYTVWHDGTLTVGKKGAARRADVLQFIRERQPHLVVDGRVLLGTLDNSCAFVPGDPTVADFLGRLVDYALLRDEYRRGVQSQR